MKKILTVTAFCLCTAMAITGCSSKNSKSGNGDKPATEKTSESESLTDNNNEPESESEITSNTATGSSEQSSVSETSSPAGSEPQKAGAIPADAGSMLYVAQSIALCESDTGLSYNINDNTFFWNATSYLMSGYGLQSAAANIDEEGNLSLPSYIVKEFADAIFADYDGNTASLPDIPGNVTSITYNADSDSYSVGAGGNASTKVTASGCTSTGDGSYSVEINLELNDGSGTVLGKWTMGIKPSTYTGSGHPLFNYTITSFEKTN